MIKGYCYFMLVVTLALQSLCAAPKAALIIGNSHYAKQQYPYIATQIQALEKAEAKGVVAGEVIHALLLKNQHAIEAFVSHCGAHPFDAGGVFVRFEMKGHFGFLSFHGL